MSNDINKDINRNLIANIKSTYELKSDMDCSCTEVGLDYKPKYNWVPLDIIPDEVDAVEILEALGLEVMHEKWEKADWVAVFIAGAVGCIADVLVNQTGILKPIDLKIKQLLKSDTVTNFQNMLDKFSNSFRNGESAPIDFQGFEMFGNKSIHEIYSFGHDPLRFIEGIVQFVTGKYLGVDKFGTLVSTDFEEKIPNFIHAIISYVAHMISDLMNANGAPYPGSTFLMEFGNEETRRQVAAAYRGQLYNSRTVIYQGLPSVLISLVIHSWAVCDTFRKTKKINLLIGKNLKYQPMLLVSNAIVSAENLSVNGIRALLGDPHAYFGINWPIIANTLRLAIQHKINESRRYKQIREEMRGISNSMCEMKEHTIEEYVEINERQYKDFVNGKVEAND